MSKLIFGDRITKNAPVLVGSSAQILDPPGKKVLLTKRGDNGRWCTPGGQLDSGESVAETCVREVFEETGLIVQVERLIGVYSNPNMRLSYDEQNQYQIVSFHFTVNVVGGELGLSACNTGMKWTERCIKAAQWSLAKLGDQRKF